MATGLIGQPFVFQILFLDEDNDPIAVNDATIQVFKFDEDGTKDILVATTAMAAVVEETGRYIYILLDSITGALAAGDVVYGMMKGTNPATSAQMIWEIEVNMIVSNAVTGGSVGLMARFVKDG